MARKSKRDFSGFVKASFTMAFDDRKKLADFVMLLCKLDKRCKKAKREKKSKPKTKKARAPCSDLAQCPHIKGRPFLFICFSLSYSYINTPLILKQLMIDTIVLTLSEDQFTITNPDAFTPSAQWLAHKGSWAPGIKSKQYPKKYDLKRGRYTPRLTLSPLFGKNKKYLPMLRIELSLPKLLFGNNFQELRYKDLRPCIDKLVDVLKTMGVLITHDILEQAPVSAIHYAKNILLTDGSTPYHYINKIKEANVKLSLDVNQTDYRNDGYSYRWHCNSYEVIFYDKIKDLEVAYKSSKRSLEKDTLLQFDLFNTFQKRKKGEILRMEVRLNKRQKIKQLFSALKIKAQLTFKSLFKPAISKKVLLYYLDELESKRLPLLDYTSTNSKALLSELVINNPELKPKQILQLYGLKHALDIMPPRELRMLFKHHNTRSWNQLITEAGSIKASRVHNVFNVLRVQLERFKTIYYLRRN